jgi:hypothetical protein
VRPWFFSFALRLSHASLGISAFGVTLSGGDRPPDAGRLARGNRAAAGQEFAGVLEEDDAVA